MWQAQEFAEAVQFLRVSGTLDAAGRRLTADLLARLLKTAPLGPDGELEIAGADFRDAVFVDDVSLEGVRFTGVADFSGAAFEGDLLLGSAVFDGPARFDRAIFGRRVWFGPGLEHPSPAVEGPTGVAARFRNLSLVGARFELAQDLGCMDVQDSLNCNGATFESRVAVAVHADTVSMCGTGFSRGISLSVARGDLLLAEAQFGGPSVIAAVEVEGGGRPAEVSRILSLRGADVADLLVSDVALTCCQFSGAHGLDRFRVQGRLEFAGPPTGWQRKGEWPFWRWARRRTVLEEHLWRSAGGERVTGWDSLCGGGSSGGGARIGADQVADVYRALRKGREENGDAAGGADFYFGEMEMKRQVLRRPGGFDARVERTVLTAYWLSSAYGLRAGRALTGLLVTVAVFGLAFYAGGITRIDGAGSPTLARALLFSAQSAAGLFAMPGSASVKLSYGGEAMQLALRVLGPLFIGLAIFSLRGRVRR